VEKLAVSIEEAVKMTSMSRSYLYQEIALGNLPSIKVGARRLVTVAALRAWLEGHQTTGEEIAIHPLTGNAAKSASVQ
jgi:excisionase family DNA binding protein